jgi:hypothetical protein
MKCLRCGYCCIMYDVIIIDPSSIIEDIDFDKDDVKLVHKPGSSPCPHLKWKDDKAICSIHHYKWYDQTPCFSHGQIESSKERECRLGSYMLKNKELYLKIKNLEKKNEISIE